MRDLGGDNLVACVCARVATQNGEAKRRPDFRGGPFVAEDTGEVGARRSDEHRHRRAGSPALHRPTTVYPHQKACRAASHGFDASGSFVGPGADQAGAWWPVSEHGTMSITELRLITGNVGDDDQILKFTGRKVRPSDRPPRASRVTRHADLWSSIQKPMRSLSRRIRNRK
jgi:hypothetical protein